MVAAITFWPPQEPAGALGADAARILTAQAIAYSETQRQLLEQKAALLASYLDSAMTRRVAEGGNAEAKALVDRAAALLEPVRDALAAGDFTAAERDLDEALRSLGAASQIAATARSAETEAQARVRYERLRGRIDSYLASGTAGAGTPWQSAAARLETLTAEAAALAGTGRYRDANKLLGEAYRTVVAIVAESRAGQTVVSRLSFATAQDELDYERRRNDSYEMLLDLMLSEREPAPESLRALADGHRAESRDLRRRADAAAEAGDYRTAIDRMEEATRRLARALQAGGIPVSE